MRVDIPPVAYTDLDLHDGGEASAAVAARVAMAVEKQASRFKSFPDVSQNADADGTLLEEIATPDTEGRALLLHAAARFQLSARGYHRVLRVARTIADLDSSAGIRKPHVAEALSFRLPQGTIA